jgi:hypothetical protein
VFDALAGLHGLTADNAELLSRAAAGLRFIRSMGTYSSTDHELFRIALAELTDGDAYTVETAACLAADIPTSDDTWRRRRVGRYDERRALWFTAVLRLSDALCGRSSYGPSDVYATWTDQVLYIEFDGEKLTDSHVERAAERVTALEVLTGRRLVLASSHTRRGAA